MGAEMKKTDFDGIIFDLDGTLWDATAVNKLAWDTAYEQLGYGKSRVTDEAFQACMGLLIPDIAKKIHPEIGDDKRQEYIDRCIEIEHRLLLEQGGILYDGFYEVLSALSGRYRLSVVSNCQAGYIEIFMKAHRAEAYFSDFECPGNTGLPKADNIRLVAERNGLKRPVYVGDTSGDLKAAHEAGVPFIWAEYGFGRNLEGYEYKTGSLKELMELL